MRRAGLKKSPDDCVGTAPLLVASAVGVRGAKEGDMNGKEGAGGGGKTRGEARRERRLERALMFRSENGSAFPRSLSMIRLSPKNGGGGGGVEPSPCEGPLTASLASDLLL